MEVEADSGLGRGPLGSVLLVGVRCPQRSDTVGEGRGPLEGPGRVEAVPVGREARPRRPACEGLEAVLPPVVEVRGVRSPGFPVHLLPCPVGSGRPCLGCGPATRLRPPP